MIELLRRIGEATLSWVRSLGHAAYFFLDLLRHSPAALRRFGLVVTQI
ncbi:ABC transporter permease, partial [Pseudomonas reinekei]